jgi:hypothetical protein
MDVYTLIKRIEKMGLEAQITAHELAGGETSLAINAFDLPSRDLYFRNIFILDGLQILGTDSIEERLSEIATQYERHKAKRDAWTKCVA